MQELSRETIINCVKNPIKAVNVLKVHGWGRATPSTTLASQQIPKITNAKIACLEFLLQKTNPEKLDAGLGIIKEHI